MAVEYIESMGSAGALTTDAAETNVSDSEDKLC